MLHHFFSSQLSLRRKPSRPALTVRLRGSPANRELKPWAQLFEGCLALNPGLNFTQVSFSCVQKHSLG